MRIFIVSEKAFEVSQIRSYFEKLPFKEHISDFRLDFYSAESGKAGMEKIESEAKNGTPFDLLVLSQKMKVYSGLQVAQTLTKKKMKLPPIILVTDVMDKNIVENGIKAGISAFLRIPYNLDSFEEALTKLVDSMVTRIEQRRTATLEAARQKGETVNVQEVGEQINRRSIKELDGVKMYAPWNNKPHMAMANLLMEGGDFKTPIPLLRQAIKLDFSDREPHKLLQLCYRKVGMHKEELGSLKKLLAESPRSPSLNLKVGDALLKEGDFKKASEFFKRAITLHKPSDNKRVKARSHWGLGRTLEKMGGDQAKEEAKGHYENAVTVDPTLVGAYFNLISSYKKLGMEKEARAIMQKAVKVVPGSARDWLDLFFYYMEEGETQKAKFALNKALSMEGDDPSIHFDVGEVFLKNRMFKEAVHHFEKSAELYPSDVRTYNYLGIAYRHTGDLPTAIERYQAALKVDPEDSNVRFNLGRAFVQNNQPDKAKEQFEQALRINPELVEAKEAIASLSKAAG